MDIRDYFGEKRLRIDGGLEPFPPAETKYASSLSSAMRYSVFGGGKRLRPIPAMAAYEAVRGKGDRIILYPCASEIFDQKVDPLRDVARFVLESRS